MRSTSGNRTHNCGNSSIMCYSHWLCMLHGEKLTVRNENLSQKCDDCILSNTATLAAILVLCWITANSIPPTSLCSLCLARVSFTCAPVATLCDTGFQHQTWNWIILYFVFIYFRSHVFMGYNLKLFIILFIHDVRLQCTADIVLSLA